MTHKPRHRHFVALPLLGLLLLGVAGMNRLTMAMDAPSAFGRDFTVASQNEERQLSLPDAGISLLLEPKTRVSFDSRSQILRIAFGTVLMAEAGLASVDLGLNAKAEQFMGSMMVLRDDASSTVIAFQFPLIVTVAGKEWILPPAYQLRVDASGSVQRSEVPGEWFTEQLSRSRALPVTPLPSSTLSEQSLLVQLLKSDTPSIRCIAALDLSLLADRTNSEASDGALLSETLRSLGTSELLFSIPALAFSVLRPLPSSLIDLWVQVANTSAASDPLLTASVLHDLLPLPSAYEAAGYPKQAILWHDAIRRVSVLLSPLLSGAESENFTADIARVLQNLSPESSLQDGARENNDSALPASVLSDQVLSASRNFLLSKNVLFTTTTAFAADRQFQGCVRVSGVFLGSDPDHPYAFSLCMGEQMIRRIERDGKSLPNDVPFEKFFL